MATDTTSQRKDKQTKFKTDHSKRQLASALQKLGDFFQSSLDNWKPLMQRKMTMELFKKHRPKKFSELVGQERAVKSLSSLLKNGFPHSLLLMGPSGCGKTTIARILRGKLNCSKRDFNVVDAADFRGIDTIREIRSRMPLHPMGGDTKIWLLDEAHKLSGDAQNAMLKMLEDTPRHVYFVLATTDPNKLIKTVRNRCSKIRVRSLKPVEMKTLIAKVCSKEDLKLSTQVVNRIVDAAEGSARLALVILNQIQGLETEKEQLAEIESTVFDKEVIMLYRALVNPRNKWEHVEEVLKELDISDTENIEATRRQLIGYAASCMLNQGRNKRLRSRAHIIIEAFRDPLFDSGRAGFIANCYSVFTSK